MHNNVMHNSCIREKSALPRIHFQLQLAELKDKLMAMAALAQQAVESAVDAYLQRDKGLCKFVKQNETAINTAQRELDEMAYELLAKEQPMAIDLRFILAVIKINGDLERIGDQSMGIARRTKETLEMEEVDLPVDFAAMGEFAGRMIRSAVQALLDGDARLAESVREMDDEIDRMNRRAHTDLLQADRGAAAVYAAGDEGHPGGEEPGADRRSRIEYRHRRHLLDSRRRCAAPAEHVDGLMVEVMETDRNLGLKNLLCVSRVDWRSTWGSCCGQSLSYASRAFWSREPKCTEFLKR